MSTDQLRSLLDDMLSEVDSRRDAEARGDRRPAPVDEEPPPAAPEESDDGTTFGDVEQLRALDDVSFCKVLAGCAGDDLLTVLSGASKGLQRKILTNMSSDSVAWLKQNLEYFDEPTRALLASGQRKMLGVANKLLAGGAIALPSKGGESNGEPGAAAPPSEEIEQLGAAIAELLDVVARDGVSGLSEVVSAGADPLLDEGIALLVHGAEEAELTAKIDAKKSALLAAYSRRLAVVREGLIAMAKGENAESFRKRLGRIT